MNTDEKNVQPLSDFAALEIEGDEDQEEDLNATTRWREFLDFLDISEEHYVNEILESEALRSNQNRQEILAMEAEIEQLSLVTASTTTPTKTSGNKKYGYDYVTDSGRKGVDITVSPEPEPDIDFDMMLVKKIPEKLSRYIHATRKLDFAKILQRRREEPITEDSPRKSNWDGHKTNFEDIFEAWIDANLVEYSDDEKKMRVFKQMKRRLEKNGRCNFDINAEKQRRNDLNKALREKRKKQAEDELVEKIKAQEKELKKRQSDRIKAMNKKK